MPDVSIIIPWRGGEPHREASLSFVTVWLRHVLPDASLELADDGRNPFSRGASIDQAVAATSGDVIVVCDADILIPGGQLTDAVDLAAAADGQVIPFVNYRYLTRAASEALRAGAVSDNGWSDAPDEWTYAVGVGAASVFSRATHEQSGGHPGFRGWGMEDVAFFLACETLVAPLRRVPGDVLHLWHPTGGGGYYDRDQTAANVALLDRYSAVSGDPAAMRALVAELRAQNAPDGGV